jgi:drug/metabolite transporter (DMT)-like permease
MKPFFLTGFALTAFAFNSILCRLALGTGSIDAAAFTSIRLMSGAVALLIVTFVASYSKKDETAKGGDWISAALLFLYAAPFSIAYLGVTTATGALILFGVVQITMLAVAIATGDRPGFFEYAGILTAFAGLIYLVLPGLESPSLASSLFMATAGIAWGLYTLRGRGSANPLADTTGNFVRTIPFVFVLTVFTAGSTSLSWRGVGLAVLSGAIASGVGYAVWYAALEFHTAARAAVLQLAVPLIAAVGGILFMNELLTPRLGISSLLILGGILVVILSKR